MIFMKLYVENIIMKIMKIIKILLKNKKKMIIICKNKFINILE
jgi:hypothetical protein